MMHSLPSGWTETVLPELVGTKGLFVDGDWIETKDQNPRGDVRLIQLADIGDGTFLNRSNRFLTTETAKRLRCTFLKPGDVLVARMPDPLGRACIFPGVGMNAVTAVDVCIIRPNSDVNRSWLMFAINSPQFRMAIASLQSGSTRKRISRQNLGKLPLPLPPPCAQVAIVSEIEKHFTRLEAAAVSLKQVLHKLAACEIAVLRDAVTGKLVEAECVIARRAGYEAGTGAELVQRLRAEREETWRDRSMRRRRILPELPGEPPATPKGWTWATLDDISLQIGDVDHKMPKASAEGIPYVSTKDFIAQGGIDFEHAKLISASDFRVLARKIKPDRNDILISRYGTVGEVRLVNTDREFQASYSVAIVKTLPSMSAQFLAIALRSPQLQGAIRQRVRASSQPDLGLEYIRTLVVPIPPRPEQDRIVAEVERRVTFIRSVEEQHVRFHPLRVKNACRQAEEGVNVAFV
jgi:type I restriction enzyme S subunit